MTGAQHRNRKNGLPLLAALALLVGACSNSAPVFECSDCACEIGTWELLASGEGPDELASAPLVAIPTGLVQFGFLSITRVRRIPVWQWADDAWTDITTGDLDMMTTPANRSFLTAAYHSDAEHTVLVGGATTGLDDPVATWTFSLNQEWTRAADDMPAPRLLGAAAYDPEEARVIVSGGGPDALTLDPDTWAWDGEAWTVLPIEGPTPARQGPAMTYDGARQAIVLFGGRAPLTEDVEYLNDTWIYDNGTWTEVTTPNAPPGRAFHDLTYYPDREVTVLFGGSREGVPIATAVFDDAWTWDGADWKEVHTPGAGPPDGTFGMAAYDVTQRGVVVHQYGLVVEQQTWSFTLTDVDAATGQCCGDGICQFPERNPRQPSQACPADCTP